MASSSKFELAEYLVDLHTLLMAQEQAGGLAKSDTLLNEYNKNWGLLKDIINKENEDARKR